MIRNPKRQDRVIVRPEGEEPFRGEIDRVESKEMLVVIQDSRSDEGELVFRRVKARDCKRLVKRLPADEDEELSGPGSGESAR